MPSDDERSEKKFTYDGGDWRRLTSRIKPVLYEKKSGVGATSLWRQQPRSSSGQIGHSPITPPR